MRGRGSQRKGREAELQLAAILRRVWPLAEAAPVQNYGEKPDIENTGSWHIEAKRCERLQIPAWTAQAERDAERFGQKKPLLFFRSNRQPWRVVIRADDLLELLAQVERDDDL